MSIETKNKLMDVLRWVYTEVKHGNTTVIAVLLFVSYIAYTDYVKPYIDKQYMELATTNADTAAVIYNDIAKLEAKLEMLEARYSQEVKNEPVGELIRTPL